MRSLTGEWLDKAEEDYSVATGLLRRRNVPANSICFHSRQAAEKYLKGLLQEQGIRFGKTHDLEDLLRLVGDRLPQRRILLIFWRKTKRPDNASSSKTSRKKPITTISARRSRTARCWMLARSSGLPGSVTEEHQSRKLTISS